MNEELYDSYVTATSTFLAFNGLYIESIWNEEVEGCLDKVILKFEKESLVIKAVPDDDSVQLFKVSNSEAGQLLQFAEPAVGVWSKFIGQKFGWGWITVNQQNYLDGVLLSFNEIVPNVLLNVMASSLYVFEIREIDDLTD